MDHDEETAKVAQMPGHMVYVRMCQRKEKIGMIYLPEKSRDDYCTIWEVLAIGRKVDEYRPREAKFRNALEMDRNAVIDVEAGDTIIIPEKATEEGHGYADFVRRSPYSEYEGSIDKGLILAKIP
jgi:hypothetical protein